MSNCEHCGGCDKCNGCAGSLEMAEEEILFLQKFGQIPFLPVARKKDDFKPVYLEDGQDCAEKYAIIIACLEKRGLIEIDYKSPLKGADMSSYQQYPIHGVMALTARGIKVLELMEIQGFTQ